MTNCKINSVTDSLTLKPINDFRQKISYPWLFTIGYLSIILFLPIAALITKASTIGIEEFWQKATQPVALSAYNVTFVTALAAGLINGFMGTLIAWILVRYQFPGRKIIDAAIDIPFAIPTSVAGLILATLYSSNGWIGQFFVPFGIKIAFTRLGVFVAMLFISLPFVVRTLQPVLLELEPEIEQAAKSRTICPTSPRIRTNSLSSTPTNQTF